jgi:hypothetical protein
MVDRPVDRRFLAPLAAKQNWVEALVAVRQQFPF